MVGTSNRDNFLIDDDEYRRFITVRFEASPLSNNADLAYIEVQKWMKENIHKWWLEGLRLYKGDYGQKISSWIGELATRLEKTSRKVSTKNVSESSDFTQVFKEAAKAIAANTSGEKIVTDTQICELWINHLFLSIERNVDN